MLCYLYDCEHLAFFSMELYIFAYESFPMTTFAIMEFKLTEGKMSEGSLSPVPVYYLTDGITWSDSVLGEFLCKKGPIIILWRTQSS